jgi:hypothetical protein
MSPSLTLADHFTSKANEITALLCCLTLAGCVVTLEAGVPSWSSQRAIVQQILGQESSYRVTLKAAWDPDFPLQVLTSV